MATNRAMPLGLNPLKKFVEELEIVFGPNTDSSIRFINDLRPCHVCARPVASEGTICVFNMRMAVQSARSPRFVCKSL